VKRTRFTKKSCSFFAITFLFFVFFGLQASNNVRIIIKCIYNLWKIVVVCSKNIWSFIYNGMPMLHSAKSCGKMCLDISCTKPQKAIFCGFIEEQRIFASLWPMFCWKSTLYQVICRYFYVRYLLFVLLTFGIGTMRYFN
jgi:hypothetical protein